VDTDEKALIERCRAGDLAAFEPLVEKYRQRAYRLAYNVLRDPEEALDAAQDAFIRAFQALPSFRGDSAFYTWLFRIVMNVARDRARQHAARGRAFGTERVDEKDWDRILVDQGVAPDANATQVEERERIGRALATLSEPHRAIIMLSDLEGLSYREIAEVLNIPMGTVMSRLHNARRRLRDALGPLLVLILTVLLTLALAAVVQAETIVRFGTRIVLASDTPPPPDTSTKAPEPPDERLEAFLPKLRQLFRYNYYTSLERYRAEVPVGKTQRWPVPGDRRLEVTPQSVKGGAVSFNMRLTRGTVTEVSTNIQAQANNPAVLGGPKHGSGTLIIILWTNPSP
jgi:RNA polymerase sigma-70 factor (ECF subfamily)